MYVNIHMYICMCWKIVKVYSQNIFNNVDVCKTNKTSAICFEKHDKMRKLKTQNRQFRKNLTISFIFKHLKATIRVLTLE